MSADDFDSAGSAASLADKQEGEEPEGKGKGLSQRTMNIVMCCFGVLAAILGIVLIVFFVDRPRIPRFPPLMIPAQTNFRRNLI